MPVTSKRPDHTGSSTGAAAYAAWPSLATMFFDQASRLADKPCLWAKREGAYRSTSWRETAEQVTALARGLRALGIAPGERVALVAENRPEWLIADLAIMAAGAITVPAYTTNTTADHLHVLSNTGAAAAIVSTRRLAERLLPAVLNAGSMRFVVAIEPPDIRQGLRVPIHAWTGVLASGRRAPDDPPLGRLARTDTACIIHTSGSGGVPKGVTLSHGSILSNCLGAYHLLLELGLAEEVFLCFLPLSHSYEHTAGQFFPLSIGAEIYYAEGVETLATNLIEVRPTIMTAVPRLYETLHQRIVREARRAGGLRQRLFDKTIELGRRRYESPTGLGLLDRITDRVLDRLVRGKVRARFGGRLKALVSGGAPLNPEIGMFFTALGVCLLQGYGQTEAAPIVSCNPPSKVKIRTVGPPLAGVQVRIAEDGEILVRGELVMQGYWGDPIATGATVRDGWLYTGDIGVLDRDGYLEITDRKKDIIVSSGGDNLSPSRVEGILTLEPEIAQAMVYGDRRPHLVALVVPDAEFARRWASERGTPAKLPALLDDSRFQETLGAAIDKVNKTLSPLERVRRFALAAEPFTIENEMLTPTLKIRRHKITERYGETLERLYGTG